MARANDLGKKTVTLDMVIRESVGCNGVTEKDVRTGHQGEMKGFSLAGVVRTVKKSCKLRITEEAQHGLLAAAEAYCRYLGSLSGKMVDSSSEKEKGRRKTIKSRDVKHAIEIASM
ncbi:MAG TPA: hypothetical protein PKD85_01045 [Saprospiraceae bacterium]|nr:hypothetical protein [Saprospiraceae bacterium]